MKMKTASMTMLLCAALSAVSHAGDVADISRPVGIMRLSIASNRWEMHGVSLEPFDGRIEKMFADQLTSGTNASSGDRVLKWDASVQAYEQAVLVNREWWSDYTGGVKSAMSFNSGDGVWVSTRQESNRNVFICGAVPMEVTNVVVLIPAFNALARTYPSPLVLTNRGANLPGRVIDPGAPTAPVDVLVPGKGYWVEVPGETTVFWTEVRPWNCIGMKAGAPAISSLSVVDEGAGVRLTIDARGNGKLAVYYQDKAQNETFDPLRGWRLAVEGLAGGKDDKCVWVDGGANDRMKPRNVFARYYIAVRGALRQGGHGEFEIPGGQSGGNNGNGSSDSGASCPAGGTNTTDGSMLLGEMPSHPAHGRMKGRIVYVDGLIGRGQLSGRSEVIVGADGPKQKIRDGIDACADGDELVIKSGRYGEHVDISGRNLRATVRGRVVLDPPVHDDRDVIGGSTNTWRNAGSGNGRDLINNTTGVTSNEWSR